MEERISRLRQNNAMALLYFYNDHCAPCISLRPKVEALLKDGFPSVSHLLINTDEHPKLSADYSVFSAPAIIILGDGREYRRFSKYISISELSEALSRLESLMQ